MYLQSLSVCIFSLTVSGGEAVVLGATVSRSHASVRGVCARAPSAAVLQEPTRRVPPSSAVSVQHIRCNAGKLLSLISSPSVKNWETNSESQLLNHVPRSQILWLSAECLSCSLSLCVCKVRRSCLCCAFTCNVCGRP